MSKLKNLVRDRMAKTGESYQTAHRAVTRSQPLRDAGVPEDALLAWDGEMLGLHQFNIGHGANIEVVRREMAARRGRYTLDLGNYAMGLSEAAGDALRTRLQRDGIPFEVASMKSRYFKKRYARARRRGLRGAPRAH